MNSRENFTGPINLGNPEEFTILELAQLIIQLADSKSKIVYLPLPQDDPVQRKPSIELAMKELDWTPTIKFEEGVKRTISYFRSIMI